MKSLGRLLVVLLLIGNLLFLTALSMHVVRAPGKVAFVPKSQLTLIDAYVDTTNWTANDMNEHDALVKRLAQAGKAGVLSHVTGVTMTSSPRQELSKDTTPVRPTQKTAAPDQEPRQKTIFDIPGQN